MVHNGSSSVYVNVCTYAVFHCYLIVCSQDCVGAIDGVHVDAIISTSQQTPFRGRKGTTTQNVLCVCSFNMCFTYVVAGWEGSAHDARILSSTTIDRNNQFLMPPLGKYYIVDSRFANAHGFLAPFRVYTSHFRRLDAEVDSKVVKNFSTTNIIVFAMSLNGVLVF
ncbi:hypothetical protein LINPERHAP1_LOCUS30579 [Linum perenne]